MGSTLAGSSGADADATLGPTGASTTGPHASADEAPPAAGERIGHFVVQRLLGRGAMGMVMLALDPELDRPVAVKLLAPHYHHGSSGETARQRLIREAQAVARLSHPNVIAVHQVGTHGDRVYMVMEYVDGGTLRQWHAEGPRSVGEILAVYRQAAQGLAAAHAAGLVHRDFKPDNVLIGRDGRVRVSDFGLVTGAGAEISTALDPGLDASIAGSGSDVRLTQTGALIGTPAYMAPEQFASAPVDARADQFSLCVALFEGLYGTRPFAGNNVGQLYAAIEMGRIAAPTRDDVPASVHGALMRGLAVDPNARHASMNALMDALRVTARRRLAGPSTLVVVAGIAGVVVLVAASVATYLTTAGRDTPLALQVPSALGQLEATDECPAPPDDLPGVWDAQAAEGLREAYAATGIAGSGELYDRTRARAQAYADSLRQARHAACLAQHGDAPPSDKDLAGRTRCLDDAQNALQGTVQALRDHPSVAQVHAGIGFLESMPSVVECADPEILAVAPTPPDDAVRPKVDQARRHMWRAALHLQSEEPKDAAAPLQRAQALADEAGYAPLAAEVATLDGLHRASSRDLPGAQAKLGEAIALAKAAHHPAVEANAAIALVRLVGFDPTRSDEALQLVAPARDAATRARSAELQWSLQLALADTYAVQGRHADAEIALTKALELLDDSDPPRHADRAFVLSRRAAMLRALDRGTEAQQDYETALRIDRETLGTDHPAYVGRLIGFATLLYTMGKGDAARDKIGEARRIFERAGSDFEYGVDVMWTLGLIEETAGDNAAAIEAYEEALRRQEIAPSPRVPTPTLLQRLGVAYLMAARNADAERVLARAQAQLDEATQPLEVAAVLVLQAQVALAVSDLRAAAEHVSRAIGLYKRVLGAWHPYVASTQIMLADIEVTRGDCDHAVDLYREALEVRTKVGVAPDVDLARIYIGEASCHLDKYNHEEARRVLDEADATIRDLGLEDDMKARAALARAYLFEAEGDRDEARRYALTARADFHTLGPAFTDERADVDAWLRDHPAIP